MRTCSPPYDLNISHLDDRCAGGLGVPGAGEGHVPGVAQVDQTAGQLRPGGVLGRAGGQSPQLTAGVHAAGGRWEAPHLPLETPPHGHHVTPSGGRGRT